MAAHLFVGREKQLRSGYRMLVQILEGNPRNCMIGGARAIGKSWLAQALMEMARGKREFLELLPDKPEPFAEPLLVGHFESRKGATPDEIARGLIKSLRTHLAPSLGRIADVAEINLGVVKLRPDQAEVGDLAVETVRQLREIWRDAQGNRGGILLVIDEMDEAAANDELASFLKVLLEELGRAELDHIAILCVGLEGVAETLRQHHGSVPRLFQPINVPRLTDEEAADLIDTALLGTGVTISAEGRDMIVKLAAGEPNAVQTLGSIAFDRVDDDGRDVIELADVQDLDGGGLFADPNDR